jgi:hypothetical protein
LLVRRVGTESAVAGAMLQRSGVLLVVLNVAAMLMTPHALADNGGGFGAGPVIAVGRRIALGWEAGATTSLPLLKVSVGGSYALSSRRGVPNSWGYIAYEPWLVVGATVGVAVDGELRSTKTLYGAWQGIPVFVDNGSGYNWVLTLAAGWRVLGGEHQFYFTPKAWWYEPVKIEL